MPLVARPPFAARALLDFLAARAVPGLEEVAGDRYRRSLRLAHGGGVLEVVLRDGADVAGTLLLEDDRDRPLALAATRRLLDLDADPVAIDAALGADPLLAPLVAAIPGRRVPGTVDGAELAVRAVLGQQVSVAAARTTTARLVAALGEPLAEPVRAVTHRFPAPAVLAELAPAQLPGPATRVAAVRAVAGALAAGELDLTPGANAAAARAGLLALPGIGPWTAEYVTMRTLGDGDAFPAGDLGLRHALARLGRPVTPAAIAAAAEPWRPYRAYALQHLWAALC